MPRYGVVLLSLMWVLFDFVVFTACFPGPFAHPVFLRVPGSALALFRAAWGASLWRCAPQSEVRVCWVGFPRAPLSGPFAHPVFWGFLAQAQLYAYVAIGQDTRDTKAVVGEDALSGNDYMRPEFTDMFESGSSSWGPT